MTGRGLPQRGSRRRKVKGDVRDLAAPTASHHPNLRTQTNKHHLTVTFQPLLLCCLLDSGPGFLDLSCHIKKVNVPIPLPDRDLVRSNYDRQGKSVPRSGRAFSPRLPSRTLVPAPVWEPAVRESTGSPSAPGDSGRQDPERGAGPSPAPAHGCDHPARTPRHSAQLAEGPSAAPRRLGARQPLSGEVPAPEDRDVPPPPPLASGFPLPASFYIETLGTHTEIKRVAEEKVTLPCHHQLGLPEKDTLDIEWLLTDNEGNQKVVITYSSRHVYNNLTEEQKGRVAFASNFLAGDASLQIEPLKPSDEGRYTCKVKNSGRYVWSHVILKVLVKPSKPKCELEGELTEGSDLTLQCESSSGTKPIMYHWQRIPEKEGEDEHLPPKSKIDYSNPGRILLQNLTMSSSGLYQCTAGNEAGKESCVVRVTVQYVQSIGMIAGAVTGMVAGALLIFLLVWLLIRRKDKERYEEEERPNEIREDAEAPKARLVKPSSSSSGSRSSRSGSSSTRSTANSASRSQRTLSTEAAPQPGLATHAYSIVGPEVRGSEPKRVHHATLTKAEPTCSTIPSQSRAFQTV
ncbi:PREDICTED: CXADR-like membrane protein [Condylura cristata]|uniref:CXADR-like membrane protein n=1 Tax=Condylura cristata TaxID=143302 RepID=UPI0006430F8E|nr:PREDICTED: CXADR-like membrane protein [Condylura cristata]